MFSEAMLTPALQRLAKTRANFMPYLSHSVSKCSEVCRKISIDVDGVDLLAEVNALLIEVRNGRLEAIPVLGDRGSDGSHHSLKRVTSLLN